MDRRKAYEDYKATEQAVLEAFETFEGVSSIKTSTAINNALDKNGTLRTVDVSEIMLSIYRAGKMAGKRELKKQIQGL